MSRFISKRSFREWLAEPGTQSGAATLGVAIGSYFGLPPDVSMGIISLISAVAVIRRG